MEWWKKAVVYQVYPMSFKDSNGDGIGDIGGVIEKVDYLNQLGVDVIWLTPVYESPMDDNGYDISNYYKINPLFGTMEQLEELLGMLHDRGMKLIMDLVVNHTSDEHEWFRAAKADKKSKYHDYYIWEEKPITGQQSFFSGSVWEYNAETDEYYYHLFSKRQPDLNWKNPNVRKEVYQLINWWLDKGINGFRMDVIDLIGKVPGKELMISPQTHEYLQEMHQNCFAGREVFTVGETSFATPITAPMYSKPERKELTMVFGFEHLGLEEVKGNGKWDLKKLDVNELKQVFKIWQHALYKNGWNSLFWSNHDQPRIVSRMGDDGRYRRESAKMLAMVLHGMQGTPYIYQGEEIGMTNVEFPLEDYKDVETINMVQEKLAAGWSMEKIMKGIYAKGRDNARTPMQWSAKEYAGFTNGTPWIKVNPNYSEINVEKELSIEESIFSFYQSLIQIRKTYDIISEGDFKLLAEEDARIFSYVRTWNGQELYVVGNFTGEEVVCPSEISKLVKNTDIILTNYKETQLQEEIVLRPYESIMWYKADDSME
ncbi:alpha,alpha-phosphotrehalase [Faecalicatena contorta]|uniref:Oligo-1,6-glucosidase/glucan 1,6-alpha-glucosidase n=1 Tax=Faecalicatena contorta TaxID=39482 RepID=A0A315ZZ01_9FIRM|nr:alpha,alpha-phosphotrehalase [Faecalicatena contorta]PWJ50482.1 oligo-1,6-glucosidase/glucan 1,6-alpha-glucosidase [Faecalicatena contorta]SUQ13890.1 oligo-1,6-glucosidase/glucan 1,6-alpha-glucosidase [Faecalicatena contorta]